VRAQNCRLVNHLYVHVQRKSGLGYRVSLKAHTGVESCIS
jgi:hypothetical protein